MRRILVPFNIAIALGIRKGRLACLKMTSQNSSRVLIVNRLPALPQGKFVRGEADCEFGFRHSLSRH